MPFGLSFGKNKSQSESVAHGFSVGASATDAVSESGSTSRSEGFSTQDIAFADLFAAMFGNATGAAGRAIERVPELQTQAATLFNAGTGFLDSITGGSAADELRERAGDDALVEEEIELLQSDIGRLFEEELLPQVTDEAVAGNVLGGSRQGVAQGRAIDTAAREFRRGATDIRTSSRERRDALLTRAAELTASGSTAGIASLPGLQGLLESGIGAELGVFDRLSGILGPVTTLTESGQTSEADAASFAESIARSFNFSEDFAKSTSSSSGKSFGFNFAA